MDSKWCNRGFIQILTKFIRYNQATMISNAAKPAYLNNDFFKTALEKRLKTNGIDIHSLDISMGSAAGDNYSSNIFRARISYTQNGNLSQSISLIVKSIPNDEVRKLIFELDAPEKEIYFYQHLASKLESLLSGTRIAPKCFYVTKEPLYTLVFEDLRTQGFTLGVRQRGLNESECKLVLDRLGKYHAASMYLLEKEPELFSNPMCKHGLLTPVTINNPLMESYFVDSLKTEIGVVGSWPGFEKYAKKMQNIYTNIKERILATVEQNNDELKVLVHGDLWVNNFMLKYSSSNQVEAIDVQFLDFQAYFVISPGIDINYFFNTSVQYDVLLERRDFLVEYYYESLRSTLQNLKYQNIPSLETIKTEIRRKEFYGFISAVGVLPIICIDESNSHDCDIELFSDKDAVERKRQLACKTARFKEVMKYVLKRADELGVLD